MNKAAVQSRVRISTQDGDSSAWSCNFLSEMGFLHGTGQVTHRAGNDGYLVSLLGKVIRQLVMTSAAWFVNRCKSLVYK